MSAAVCLAARMPAIRAVCSGSPFFTLPERTRRIAVRDMVIRPRATASRSVTGLSPTSTILTRPRRSTCDSLFLIAIVLRQEERQAFERDGQVDALQLHAIRDSERPGRKVQDGLDAGSDHQVE